MIDAQPTQADSAAPKDKRPLVLFLLGLVLLAGHWLPLGQDSTIQSYGVVLEENGRQWRVISNPVATATDLEGMGRRYPLLPKQGSTDHLPAQLALFVNRPLPINQADQTTLEMLPNIGPRLATAIIKTSRQAGRFAGPDDLLKVPGIGPATMQRLAPLITFEP